MTFLAWFVLLEDKKGVTIVNGFQSILNDLKRKPNKVWVDKGNEFYNISIKSWLQDNNIDMYSSHNERNLLFLKELLGL